MRPPYRTPEDSFLESRQMNKTVSVLKCAIQIGIFMLGIGSCLAYQTVHHLYSEAKACEAVECLTLQKTETDVKNFPPPALTQDKKAKK